MADLLTTVSVLLAVASTTLAIAAFVFSWVSFRNTSQMQMNAQAILAQISQRVEVVVERTSQQMDKAWEYFTSLPTPLPSIAGAELAQREEELRAQIIEEARQEVGKEIENAGLDKNALKSLLEQVESVIDRSTERTRQVLERQDLLGRVSEIEQEMRDLAAERGIDLDPAMPFALLLGELGPLLPSGALADIHRLVDLRARAMHGDLDCPEEELREHLRRADRVLAYLRWTRHREAKPR